MKQFPLRLGFSSLALFTLLGCGGDTVVSSSTDFTNTTVTTPIETTPTDSTSIDMSSILVSNLGSESNINQVISLGTTPKSLYLVLSNKGVAYTPTIVHNAPQSVGIQQKIITQANVSRHDLIRHAPHEYHTFRATSTTEEPQNKIVLEERRESVVGESHIFYREQSSSIDSTTATLKNIVSNVTTTMGTKTLNIWVSDDSFGSGCRKTKCVTQEMVDILAESFLKAGLDNDIYDWVTNIYGEEWGSTTQTEFIGTNDEITILLTDIDNDNSESGGVIGFFWSKDNYLKSMISGSNERIMFYLDSVMFANNEGTIWSIESFWAKEAISTLAHEFYHMISYYQKNVLLRSSASANWLEEMIAETTEDVVATKLKHNGPRNVVYTNGGAGGRDNSGGRYPLYNQYNTLSLTDFTNLLAEYSKVSAFGTYLIRNYGGVTLLHDMLHNTYTDENAVVNAVVNAVNKSVNGATKSFSDLLHEWGISVILSDQTNLTQEYASYNTGDFTPTTYNGTTYQMGSINFFNYVPMPRFYTSAGTISSDGNYFYKIGDNLSGDITLNLTLNGMTEVSVIAK